MLYKSIFSIFLTVDNFKVLLQVHMHITSPMKFLILIEKPRTEKRTERAQKAHTFTGFKATKPSIKYQDASNQSHQAELEE